MNAIELYWADGTATGIFYCATCRVVKCSGVCLCCGVCECGAVKDLAYDARCGKCREVAYRLAEVERERVRFEKAVKLTAGEWEGYVYAEGCSDEYFSSVGALLDWLEDEDGEPPAYVWATRSRPVCVLDVDRILENATQEAYEDFGYEDLNGIEELRAAVEAFNERNRGVVVYEADLTRAVVITAEGTPEA